MKKAISIAKIITLYLIMAIAAVCIFSEPIDDNMLMTLIISKAIGFGCALIALKLCKRWKNDYYLNKINHILEDE